MATIQSDMGEERTNWQVLVDDLHQDNLMVVANRMNPKQAGFLQTRERLYQIWYGHEYSKKNNLKFAIDDNRVQFAAVDADNHMTFLNSNMDLGVKLSHLLLPNHDRRVLCEASAVTRILEAKAKKADKTAANEPPAKKRRTSAASSAEPAPVEDDADLDSGNNGSKKVKWHEVHREVWAALFNDHNELRDVEWTLEAASSIPNRYKGNPFFESLCVRSRDIVRMLDMKFPLEQLSNREVVVDLLPWLVYNCFSSASLLS